MSDQQPDTPQPTRFMLQEALIGSSPQTRRLYWSNAHFRQYVDMLVMTLPSWVQVMAEQAEEAEQDRQRLVSLSETIFKPDPRLVAFTSTVADRAKEPVVDQPVSDSVGQTLSEWRDGTSRWRG